MKIQTAKRLAGINEYYFSGKLAEIDAMNREGKNVINLGIGSPDLPPHPDVIKTLNEEASRENTHAYQGYRGSIVLRNAISQWYKNWYNVSLDAGAEILPLIGSKEGIVHVCMTYLDKGDRVLVPNPGYPAYRTAVELAGAEAVTYELKKDNHFYPDFDAMEKAGLQQVKLMFVNYPHMPTGRLPSEELFIKLVAFAKKHNILLVHDNPYSFIMNDQPLSLLAVNGAIEVGIELNSLSKSHNMAGWRVGMICGKKERIDEILKFKSNMDSGMFLPVQLAAAKALNLGKEWHEAVNAVYRARKLRAHELLRYLGCDFDEEQAGLFVWAQVPSKYKDGYELSDAVLNKSNVFITPGGIFGTAGNNYVRISLCSTEDKIKEAIKRLRTAGLGPLTTG